MCYIQIWQLVLWQAGQITIIGTSRLIGMQGIGILLKEFQKNHAMEEMLEECLDGSDDESYNTFNEDKFISIFRPKNTALLYVYSYYW